VTRFGKAVAYYAQGATTRSSAMTGPQQLWLLRGVVASRAMPAIVAAPGPQGTNDP
jgi:hypothetical protein